MNPHRKPQVPKTGARHWFVTVRPKNGSADETFWISSINERSAMTRALKLCGAGAKPLAIQPRAGATDPGSAAFLGTATAVR
jgi:hypothetical protein